MDYGQHTLHFIWSGFSVERFKFFTHVERNVVVVASRRRRVRCVFEKKRGRVLPFHSIFVFAECSLINFIVSRPLLQLTFSLSSRVFVSFSCSLSLSVCVCILII